MAEVGTSSSGDRFNLRLVRVESEKDAIRLITDLGSDHAGVRIMSRKMVQLAVAAENVQARAAHIIKEVMLSRGGECATPKELLLAEGTERMNVIMIGTLTQLRRAAKNFSVQPFGLKALSRELKAVLARASGLETSTVQAGGHALEIGGRTHVMGVVNLTPDSFSDPGRFERFEDARKGALEMVEAGADIIDVGGESTRPGSGPVPLEEELHRTVPLIESLAGEIEVPISIDTCKAEVARRALDAGAVLINDISGLRFDPGMIPLAAEREVPVVIMHMQGTPRDMQDDPAYDDVVSDICRFLRERAALAVEGGVDPGKILVDPGIGFGKTVEHNLEIIRRIEEFGSLPYPLVLGTSRKRFIGAVLDKPPGERLLGTAATVAFAIARGVDVVRVHDVGEMVEVVRVADACAGKIRNFDRPEL